MAMNLDTELRAAFRTEAVELLAEMDDALLALEGEPRKIEIVHRVFRAIHTLKGSGAMVGLTRMAAFAHGVEEAFDRARDGKLAVTPQLIDCGLRACDVIRSLLADDPAAADQDGEAAVRRALQVLLPALAGEEPAHGGGINGSGAGAERVKRQAFEILLRPGPGLFASGTDPVTLLDELRGLGTAHITARTEGVPSPQELDAEVCYLWWEILLVTSRGHQAVREVFEFVEDECQISIRLLEDQAGAISFLGGIRPDLLEAFLQDGDALLAEGEHLATALDKSLEDGRLWAALAGCHRGLAESIRALVGQMTNALTDGHPLERLQAQSETLADWARAGAEAPEKAAALRRLREAGEALNGTWQGLTGQVPALPWPPEVAKPGEPAKGNEAGSFPFAAQQCLETIAICLGRIESDRPSPDAMLRTYVRGLRTLAAMAVHYTWPGVAEPVAFQLAILEGSLSRDGVLGAGERESLETSLAALRTAASPAADPEPGSANVPAEPAASGTAIGTAAPAAAASTATIRIDQEKLDRLMRVVGELLVARGTFPVLVQQLQEYAEAAPVAKELKEAGSAISRIAEELQASVMSIRMLPVKTVFQRFPRLVRDLARTLAKEVQFAADGESIELDKTILEQIGDPLVHLVRNAVDHGLEPAAERLAKGKPAAGQLLLRARSEAGAVVIEVVDDGRGLDAAALRRKAVDRGVLTAEAAAALSDEGAYELIFCPGLSTAEKVTDVSGRGVGMDVVRSNIRALQGSIRIQSQRGQGTTFSVRLPTSLMVSKGILLEAGGQEYLLPLTAIRDMVKVPASAVHRYGGGRMVQVRGQVYPVHALVELFELGSGTPATELSIAIVEAGDERYGLLVDRFVTELEVIVKPLTGGLERCRDFQGAAILGDGRVALVLNPVECHRAAFAAPAA